MRILQVVHTYVPESAGGTEIHTQQLVRDLRAHHDVAVLYRVFAPDRPDLELSESSYEGTPVYRLVNNFTWSRGPLFDYFCPDAEPRFLQVLDRFQPDLVHFQHLGGGLSTSFLTLAAERGLPTVFTLHDFWTLCSRSHLLTPDGQLCTGPEGGMRCIGCRPAPVYAPPVRQSWRSLRAEVGRWGWKRTLLRLPGYAMARLLRPWLEERAGAGSAELSLRAAYMARDRYFRALLDRPDALLAPSQFLRRTFEAWGLPPGRIRVVRNGVDAGDLTQPRVPGEGKLRLVFVGSILAYKGLDVLVEAMQHLRDAPVELRIYGDDQATPEVAAYAADLRRKAAGAGVRFMGPLPHEELGQALARADALVLPSVLYENCPLSILEAFSARVPVIASNIGGMAELVHDGRNGLQFEVGNAQDLAAKIRRLAADPQLLHDIQRGIQRPATTEQVSRTIERIYQDVIDLKRQGRCGVDAQQAIARGEEE